MEFMEVWCLQGRVCCTFAAKYESVVCNLGMFSSFPAGFATFLSVFSKIFHNLMDLELVVATFKYLPCWASQSIPVMF